MEQKKTVIDELKGTAAQIKAQVEALIRKGNARRVIVKNKEGRVLFQSQLNLGLAGTAILGFSAPVLTALGAVLLYANDVRVFIEMDVAAQEGNQGQDAHDVSDAVEVVDITEPGPAPSDSAEDAETEPAKTVG
jgi:hypothetical protein